MERIFRLRELGMIPILQGNDTAPYPLQGTHDGELLRGDEALEHDSDGHIHVILADLRAHMCMGVGWVSTVRGVATTSTAAAVAASAYIVSEVHLGMALRHADHGLDVTHCNGNTSRHHALAAQLRVQLRNLSAGGMLSASTITGHRRASRPVASSRGSTHLVIVDVGQLRAAVHLGVQYILLKQLLRDGL